MKKKIKKKALREHPKLEAWKKILLALPILLSISGIFYLQYNQRIYNYQGVELLSPSNAMSLMTALIIFTVGYIIFLSLMFSENLHEMIWRMFGGN